MREPGLDLSFLNRKRYQYGGTIPRRIYNNKLVRLLNLRLQQLEYLHQSSSAVVKSATIFIMII